VTGVSLGDVRADAVHGSYCPKMCGFACPVAAATGREDTTPWGLHTTIAALATGRVEPSASTATALVGCTGCHACRDACLYSQDVPTQVRAARAAHVDAGVVGPDVAAAVGRAMAGESPFGTTRSAAPDADAAATVTVVAGCRDDDATVAAAVRLFAVAGIAARAVVPSGCCGGAIDDLGDRASADELRRRLAAELGDGDRVVALDPHCIPSLRRIADPVVDVVAELATHATALRFTGPPATVTWHDPCLLARDESGPTPARVLLGAAGFAVAEVERSGADTACSGAGMAMEIVAPAHADAVARRRAVDLAATGVPALTACGGARRRLADAGADVTDLLVSLAARLEDAP